MTDLRQVSAQMVSLQTPMNVALERMIKGGVRLLLVADRTARSAASSSRDIQGEKPMKLMETGTSAGN